MDNVSRLKRWWCGPRRGWGGGVRTIIYKSVLFANPLSPSYYRLVSAGAASLRFSEDLPPPFPAPLSCWVSSHSSPSLNFAVLLGVEVVRPRQDAGMMASRAFLGWGGLGGVRQWEEGRGLPAFDSRHRVADTFREAVNADNSSSHAYSLSHVLRDEISNCTFSSLSLIKKSLFFGSFCGIVWSDRILLDSFVAYTTTKNRFNWFDFFFFNVSLAGVSHAYLIDQTTRIFERRFISFSDKKIGTI